ncbi:MAG: hypothetical protein ACYS5V_05450 [Planctomycetota bacterium]|jgi:hypothetical protein
MSEMCSPPAEGLAPASAAGPLRRRPGAAVTGFSLALNVMSCLILVVLLGMLVVIVPRFERVYMSFNAALPAPTIRAIDASRIVRSSLMVVVPAAVALMAGLICLSVYARHWIRAVIALAVTMLLVFLGMLVFMAVWLPLPALTRAVQGK